MSSVKIPKPPSKNTSTLLSGNSGVGAGPISRTLAPRGKTNETNNWTRKHETIVRDANAHISTSHHLRNVSSNESAKLAKQATQKQNVVNEKLKKRLKETKAMHTKLRTTESQVVSEIKLLVDARRKTDALDLKFTNPLNKCNGRIELRAQRPTGENIEDVATKAIESQMAAIQTFKSDLAAKVNEADALVLKMQQHLATIRSDIEAKKQAVQIDEECIQLQQDAAKFNEGTPADGLHIPELPSTTDGAYTAAKSVTHPDLWKQVSTFNVDTGRTLCNEAKDLRLKMLAVIKKMHELHKTKTVEVSGTLSQKMKQTHGHMKTAAAELKKVEAEIQGAERQRQLVIKNMQSKEAPMEVTRRRLENRQNRPKKEMVRDDVEIVLEEEFASIVRSMQSLQNKQYAIDVELKKLKSVKAQLQNDYALKQQSLALDQKCWDMDEMSMYSVNTQPNARNQPDRMAPVPYAAAQMRGSGGFDTMSNSSSPRQQQPNIEQLLGLKAKNGDTIEDGAKLPPIHKPGTPRALTPRSTTPRSSTPRSMTPRSDRQ